MVGPIEFKSKTTGAAETVAILNSEGQLLYGPTACKNYIHEVYALVHRSKDIVRDHVKSAIKGTARTDCAPFVLYCAPKTREQNSAKFCAIMNELERHLRTVGRTQVNVPFWDDKQLTAPFVAIAPLWWTKSPVMIAFYILMLRLSLRMRLNEPFDKFRARLVKCRDTHRDVEIFKEIIDNGNLDGLLNKTLPCMRRKQYADHLLSQHDRGIADYDAKADGKIPIGVDDILKWRKKTNYDNYGK
jgi:hypothetical protein